MTVGIIESRALRFLLKNCRYAGSENVNGRYGQQTWRLVEPRAQHAYVFVVSERVPGKT